MSQASRIAARFLVTGLIGAGCVLHAGMATATTKAEAAPKPAAKHTKPVKKAKAVPPPAPLAELSEEQLANAERVLTGAQQCEFNQTLAVEGAPEKTGYFHIHFKGKKYLLAPEPTTTGAVRLEDKKAGVVWLQIANKSMLMNAKIGQRMVDECLHPSQQTPAPAPAATQAS
jgi:hypothetical protein